MTRVKPCWASQISSSWRRILRWFRAKPPGRSDAASRSLMIQQNIRGSSPWAQRPRNVVIATPPPPARHRGARHRSQDRGRLDRAPTSWTRTIAAPRSSAQTTVASVASSRAAGSSTSMIRPRNALRDVPTSTGTPTAADQLGQARRAARGCARSSCRTRSRDRPSARRPAMPACARGVEALGEELADLARRRRRSAGACLHRARLALHVHRDVPRTGIRRRRRSISGSARPAETSLTIVAPASSAASATAALVVSMLIGTPTVGGERRDHRDDPCQLLGRVDRLRAGAGRLAADVEDRRAGRGQRETVGDRGVGRRGSDRRRRRSPG